MDKEGLPPGVSIVRRWHYSNPDHAEWLVCVYGICFSGGDHYRSLDEAVRAARAM